MRKLVKFGATVAAIECILGIIGSFAYIIVEFVFLAIGKNISTG